MTKESKHPNRFDSDTDEDDYEERDEAFAADSDEESSPVDSFLVSLLKDQEQQQTRIEKLERVTKNLVSNLQEIQSLVYKQQPKQ